MAKNIFSLFQGYVPKPKRNVFDLSFNNNFTTKFGQLTPVLCKEVIPGDSIKIDTAAGLRLMPMAFPVQTPMKAYVHYFYVRNRALWNDWQDFITGTKKDLVPPYIAFGDGFGEYRKKEFFKVGGIADYMGVPNTLYSTEASGNEFGETCYTLYADDDLQNPTSPNTYIPCCPSNNYKFYPYMGSFIKNSVINFLGLTANRDNVTSDTIDGEIRGKNKIDSVITISRYGTRALWVQQLEEAGSVNHSPNNYAVLPFKYLGEYSVSVSNIDASILVNPWYLKGKTA